MRAAAQLTWGEVLGHRLRRHRLVDPAPPAELAAVVSAVCVLHCQVQPAAELSAAVRLTGGTREHLRAALAARTLAKTVGPRGTIHVLPADELGLWAAAAGALSGSYEPQEALVDAVVEALRGGTLTRAELGAAVVEAVGPAAADTVQEAWVSGLTHWQIAAQHASSRGLVCYGPSRGQQVTYALVEEWLPQRPRAWGTEEALRETARRYLRAYGPATHQELAQWTSLPVARARAVIAELAASGAVVPAAVDEGLGLPAARGWLPVEDVDVAGSSGPVEGSVRLLGLFDAYAVGSHPRDLLVPVDLAARAVPHASVLPRGATPARAGRRFLCGPLPVLLVDGRVAGVWTSDVARSAGRLRVRVDAWAPLRSSNRSLLEAEAARLASASGLDADLEVGPLGRADLRSHL